VTAYSWFDLLAGTALLGVGFFVFDSNWRKRLNRVFFYLMLVLAAISFFLLLRSLSRTAEQAVFWAAFEFFLVRGDRVAPVPGGWDEIYTPLGTSLLPSLGVVSALLTGFLLWLLFRFRRRDAPRALRTQTLLIALAVAVPTLAMVFEEAVAPAFFTISVGGP